jgi:mxaJ protein
MQNDNGKENHMSRTTMHWPILACTTAIIAIVPLTGPRAQSSSSDNTKVLRVCADPDYLPFSNAAGEGFENKVAVVLAASMGRKLEYQWASSRGEGGFSNFLADNLEKKKCDVVMDLPYGDQEEGFTKPYYVSSYVFISKKSNHYGIQTMSAPILRSIKIGYEDGTTPETALQMLNLVGNAVPYHIADDPSASPEQLLQAVQDNKVGVMITWEPAIGDFLKKYPDLEVRDVPAEEYAPGIPQVGYTYQMAIGIRPDDTELKAALNKALAANKPQIDAILAQYNVRLYGPSTPGAWVNQ